MFEPAQQIVSSSPKPLSKYMNGKFSIAIFSSVVFFVLLLVLQPPYIFKKDEVEKKINYAIVLVLSLLGGLLVFGLPRLFK